MKNIIKTMSHALILLTCVATAQADSASGPYLAASIGYAPESTNSPQSYLLLPGISEQNHDKNAAAPVYALSAGIRFQLNTHLLWSIGGEYQLMQFNTVGTSSDATDAAQWNYTYKNINQSLLLDNRLYFNFSTEINYPHTYSTYVGLLVGMASNTSSNYTQSNTPVLNFVKNTNKSVAGGVELGGEYNFTRHTALGINLRYLDLGQQGFVAYDDTSIEPHNHYALSSNNLRFLINAQYTYIF